ncbi:MAG: hypothetical protein KJN68_02045 [Bacteroidia bacterium]|nr:hypothetical protein [Bacteroidia bacterium]
MKPNRLKKIAKVTLIVLLVWAGLTIWVQYSGKEFVKTIGAEPALASALIVYNPDPIYNLDEQVCTSFAMGLKQLQIRSTIKSVKAAETQQQDYDLYVFCVNTYNWTPDWRLTNFIKEHPKLKDAKVVALTVGAGATMRAQRKLEWHLSDRGADLLGSEMYWLLKPNDEARMKEKNAEVAQDMAMNFGKRIGSLIAENRN